MFSLRDIPSLAFVMLTLGSAASAQNVTPNWPTESYLTLPGISPLQVNTTTYGRTAPGYIFLATDGAVAGSLGGGPRIVTEDGEDIFIGRGHAFAFGAQTYQGKPVLAWWNGTVYAEPRGRGYGSIVIADTSYTTIANVTLPGHFVLEDVGVSYDTNIDIHEVYITPRDTVIVTANNVTNADLSSVGGSKTGWVVEAQFYEIDIKTNKVLYSWKSLDHQDQIPFTASQVPLGIDGSDGSTQEKAWGYFHINAASSFGDGYLISSRFLCSFIAIERSGDVAWRVSGVDGADFHLPSDATFSYQHQVRAVSSNSRHVTITMHDNANSERSLPKPTVASSGLVLKLDLKAKTVTKVARYSNPKNPLYAIAQGSYQSLPNGNAFIGHGLVPEIEEFSKDGEILATTQFGPVQNGMGTPFGAELTYRASKSEWAACPAQPPKVATEVNGKKLQVAVSWNGATDVKSWEIYAGSSSKSLKKVAEVSKRGFETVTSIDCAKYVKVIAVSSCCRGRDQCKDVPKCSTVVKNAC